LAGVTATEAYGAFAYAYDRALGERFFRAAQRMLDDLLAKYPTPKRTHLDLACGTGLVVDYFRTRGWKSTGVDASVAMLETFARCRSADASPASPVSTTASITSSRRRSSRPRSAPSTR
jgi:predicted TPR repeat methyltransferase